MSIRNEVREFLQLGRLPDESSDEQVVSNFEVALNRIEAPLSTEEARLLIKMFGADGCFGLAWTLLHLVETAPESIESQPPATANEWERLIWERSRR